MTRKKKGGRDCEERKGQEEPGPPASAAGATAAVSQHRTALGPEEAPL